MKLPKGFLTRLIAVIALGLSFIYAVNARTSGPHFGPWSALEPAAAFNTAGNEFANSISHDGLRFYFMRDGDIYVSRRENVNADWETPIALPSTINTAFVENNGFESIDGHWLYFGRAPLNGSDIWVSWRKNVHDDTGWQTPVNLSAVNTDRYENAPYLFVDDETGLTQLYFGAARGDGVLGTQPFADIWVSTLGPLGFETPVPVTELNDPDHLDGKPYLRNDGLEIFFASYRLSTIGPYNPPGAVFTSTRSSIYEPWSAPTPVSSVFVGHPSDPGPGDMYISTPVLSRDAETLYVCINQATGDDRGDIYVSHREKVRGPK